MSSRIIAGEARGRRIQVPGGGTRPTSDRAREGMFSSLQSLMDLEDAQVLDLYAGSGALGLEALSRGAARAVLVDDDPLALKALEANAASLDLPGAVVVDSTVERFLERAPDASYDLVVLDPPYDDDVAPALDLLAPWLSPDAVVVVERRSRGPELVWPDGLVEERARRYGEAVLRYALRP